MRNPRCPKVPALLFLALVGWTSASGCSKKPSPPETPGSATPSTERRPGTPPEIRILETKKETLGPSGGRILLGDGAGVVLPPGALDAAGEITVSRVDPASFFDGTDKGGVILSCTQPADPFKKNVLLQVPLPAGMTEADSARVYGGLLDPETEAVLARKIEVKQIEGRLHAVMETDHFSNYFFGFGEKPPPASAGPLQIPYYGQGSSDYCWAASLQMVTQAARYDEQAAMVDFIGGAGVGNDGLSSFSLRWGRRISAMVASHTGLRPVTTQWSSSENSSCLGYVKRQLGEFGRPVFAHMGHLHHAVVFVGYDGDTLYVHDPQNTDVSNIGYSARTWTALTAAWGSSSYITTLTVPTSSLDPNRPEVTVNIMNGSFRFLKPRVKDSEQTTSYDFSYDGDVPRGYSFRDSASKTAFANLPGGITEFSLAGQVEIVNSSRTDPRAVSVWLDIDSRGKDKKHISQQHALNVGPNSTAFLKLDKIKVDMFRESGDAPAEYYLAVTVLVSNQVLDRAAITFTIDPQTFSNDFLRAHLSLSGTAVSNVSCSWDPPTNRTEEKTSAWAQDLWDDSMPTTLTGLRFSAETKHEHSGKQAEWKFDGRFTKDMNTVEELTIQFTDSYDFSKDSTVDLGKEKWSITLRNIPFKSMYLRKYRLFEADWPSRQAEAPAFSVGQVDYSLFAEDRHPQFDNKQGVYTKKEDRFKAEKCLIRLYFGADPMGK